MYQVVLGVAHASANEGERAVALAAPAGLFALASLALWQRWRRNAPDRLPTTAATLSLYAMAFFSTGLLGLLDPTPAIPLHLSTLAFSTGLFLLPRDWFVSGLGAVWGLWALLAWNEAAGVDLLAHTAPLIAASLLAPAVRSVRVQAIERMQASIEESQGIAERCRALIDCAPDPILVVEESGRICFASDGITELTGWSPDELCGRDLVALIPPAQREAHEAGFERYQRTRRQTLSWRSIPLAVLHRDGRTVPVEVSFAEWRSRREVRFTGYLRDVSERLRAEAERAEIDRRAYDRQRLESIGLLASGVAHDFNNLLQPMMGNANLLAANPDLGAPARALCDEIVAGGEGAARLIRQLLDYAGAGGGQPQDLDLSAQVRAVLTLLQPGFSNSSPIHLELAGALPVHTDPAQLDQIVINLVTNAIEASAGSSQPIRVSTGVVSLAHAEASALHPPTSRSGGEYALLEVEDHGHGMGDEARRRAFEPFFTTKQEGRGIGLASVLGIARASGGGVRVRSTLGRGATFSLYLPLGTALPEKPPTPQSAGYDGTGTVLLVDDQEAVRRVTRRMLEAMGFAVVEASDGMRALKQFHAQPEAFRLAVLDFSMAGWDGARTAAELRALRADLPVLFISGFAPPEAHLVQLAGRASLLQKPYRQDALEQAIRSLLG